MLEHEEMILEEELPHGSPFSEDIRIKYVHPREVIELHLHGLLDDRTHN